MSSLLGPYDSHFGIMGGGVVSAQSDPVAQRTVAIAAGSDFCSGVLVAPDLVLTAGHCVDRPGVQYVLFGKDLRGRPAAAARVTAMKVNKAWLYSDANDIGLMRFDEGQAPSWAKTAEILEDFNELKKGTPLMVVGYGRFDAALESDHQLRTAGVEVTEPAFRIKAETVILVDQKRGMGICKGDSGGPAFLVKNRKLYLVGVASRGYPVIENCKNFGAIAHVRAGWEFIRGAAREIGRSRNSRGQRQVGQFVVD